MGRYQERVSTLYLAPLRRRMTAALLVLISLAFAWSMGAHYTGAVMGMPFAAHVIRLRTALLSLAVLTVVGAAVASEGVQRTVGHEILLGGHVSIRTLIVVEIGAFALTTAYTYAKVPTSTIQILVFCLVGAGVAAGLRVDWWTIGRLAVVWVLAPPVAVGLGYVFTRGLDRLPLTDAGAERLKVLPHLLVGVGLAASFTLGANDVSNAVGVWASVKLTPLLVAGLAGGVAMAIGALTWGQRILRRVAFDVVTMDLRMASAAQLVQAVVVLLAVAQGLFTSMNQALIGAMLGAGLARSRTTVQRETLVGIVRGWLISPISGFALCYVLERVVIGTIGR